MLTTFTTKYATIIMYVALDSYFPVIEYFKIMVHKICQGLAGWVSNGMVMVAIKCVEYLACRLSKTMADMVADTYDLYSYKIEQALSVEIAQLLLWTSNDESFSFLTTALGDNISSPPQGEDSP